MIGTPRDYDGLCVHGVMGSSCHTACRRCGHDCNLHVDPQEMKKGLGHRACVAGPGLEPCSCTGFSDVPVGLDAMAETVRDHHGH